MTEYELVPLFDRTPDGAANGIILFDIYFRGAFVGCQRTSGQAHAYIDFLQSDGSLFLKASMSPFRMMKFYKDRLASNEAAKTDYMPHPTDNSLVIGRKRPHLRGGVLAGKRLAIRRSMGHSRSAKARQHSDQCPLVARRHHCRRVRSRRQRARHERIRSKRLSIRDRRAITITSTKKTLNSLIGMRSYQQMRPVLSEATSENDRFGHFAGLTHSCRRQTVPS